MTPPVAVLDANVLFAAFARDLLMRLALGGAFHARWTDRIHDEWTRALLHRRPDLTPDVCRRLRHLMDEALPDALIDAPPDNAAVPPLPDPGDRHVVAAALVARATLVVTWNTRHFPDAVLAPLGLRAATPDGFIADLFGADPLTVTAAAAAHRASLHRPAMDGADYHAALVRAGLVATAAALGAR